jgi:putative ABC transport system permease protein
MKVPLSARVGLQLIRALSRWLPVDRRGDWRLEWEAEILHRSARLAGKEGKMTLSDHFDLLRRAFGALPDAAWVRRQLGPDADLLRDLRHGARGLWRDRGFATSAVFVLALGLGAATALFALVDGLLLRPLPYPEADRVMTLWQADRANGLRGPVAPANFLDWRERSKSFSHLAAAIPYSYDYLGADEPEVLFGAQVTEGFFDAYGVQPLLGRLFLPSDHKRGSNQICLMGERLWRHRFGADPGIVGRRLQFDGEPFEVVGILPKAFEPAALSSTPGRRDVWTPHLVADYERRIRGSAWWGVVARLSPAASFASAQAELDAISAGLSTEYPSTNKTVRVSLLSLSDHLTGSVRPALKLMLGAVALLTAIVWANVAGLLLARGIRRERELAIRASLGAGRGRLFRQLLSETLLISVLGAGLAWIVAQGALTGVMAQSPGDVPRLDLVSLDGRSFVFLATLSLLTALGCGLTPALRLSTPRLQRALHESLRASAAHVGSALRSGLVVAEIAIALLLLVGSGLVTRSLSRLLSVDPGFRSGGVATLQVFTGDNKTTSETTRQFFHDTLERMRSLPGVTGAGAVSRMPFMEANIDIRGALRVMGETEAEAGQEPQVSVAIATHGYFETMGIPIIEGRLFDKGDQAATPRVVLVNEALARRYLGRNAVGKTISLQWQGRPQIAQIAGVVGGVRQERLDGAPEPEAFLLHAQVPFSSMSYVLRATSAAGPLIEPAKRAVWAVAPSQTFYRTATLDELVGKTVADRRFLSIVLSSFAGLALLLTVSGLYGLMSVIAAERTREFGVRLALGARSVDLYRMVFRQGLRLILPGVALGLVGAALGVEALRSVLFDVSPFDPLTFAAMSVSLMVVAMTACVGPARRALSVDPTTALRAE